MFIITKTLEFIKNNWYDVECLHTRCLECKGTGRRNDGTPCVHYISCKCKRCNKATL